MRIKMSSAFCCDIFMSFSQLLTLFLSMLQIVVDI